MYSVPAPAPLYDIRPEDYAHLSFAGHYNGHYNTGSGEPSYPQHNFNGRVAPNFEFPNGAYYQMAPGGELLVLAPAFQQPNEYAFDGGLEPAFQYQSSPLSGNTPSSSSLSSPFETTLTPPPGPSFENIPQLYPELLEDNSPQQTSPPQARPRRTRGPNKRPPGTGFADLLAKLPEHVRVAVEAYNPDCCGKNPPPEEGTDEEKKENSSWQKHIFSNRHCDNLDPEIKKQVPKFVCPAFVAHHEQCKRARPGRYDSAERHCKSCPGFHEMNSKRDVYPVEINKREHEAIVEYRATKHPSAEIDNLVEVTVWNLVDMMVKAGMPLEPVKSNVPDAMDVTTAEPLERPPPVQAESAAGYGRNRMVYF